MNEHAGPACALSVLIVGVFAVLLHDKNPPPAPPRPAASDLASATPAPPRTAPRIDDHARRAAAESPPPIAPRPPPAPTPTVEIRPAPHVPSSPAPRRQPATRPRPIPARPRASTTIVEPGETLADVAARIYGEADAADAIWKANRDQLAARDAALTGGMLLRTP